MGAVLPTNEIGHDAVARREVEQARAQRLARGVGLGKAVTPVDPAPADLPLPQNGDALARILQRLMRRATRWRRVRGALTHPQIGLCHRPAKPFCLWPRQPTGPQAPQEPHVTDDDGGGEVNTVGDVAFGGKAPDRSPPPQNTD